MELRYTHPSDLTAPIHNKDLPPNPAQASPQFDSGYMDGSCESYAGANPGRDQDRSRMDERIAASYSYSSSASGSEQENETGSMEGF